MRTIKYSFDSYEVNLPKDLEREDIHAKGPQLVQFANRINIGHRIDIERVETGLGIPATVLFDANDRFVTVSVNDEMIGKDGTQKAGPGFIVIDLDEHGRGSRPR